MATDILWITVSFSVIIMFSPLALYTNLKGAGVLLVLTQRAIGNKELPHLYDLAGLHHSVEPSIMKGENTAWAFCECLQFSSNMMYARCKLIQPTERP
jgi:hypothetical protein